MARSGVTGTCSKGRGRLPQAAHDGSELGRQDLAVVIDVKFLEDLVELGDLGAQVEERGSLMRGGEGGVGCGGG